jgi:hypothetical protein
MKKRIWPRLGETLVAQAGEAGLDPARAFPPPPEADGAADKKSASSEPAAG